MRHFRIKCNDLNLSFNLEKMHSMYIAQAANNADDININGSRITQIKSLKFIGRDLNTSLTFVDHYGRVCHESLSNLNAIKMMTSCKSELTTYASLNYYISTNAFKKHPGSQHPLSNVKTKQNFQRV